MAPDAQVEKLVAKARKKAAGKGVTTDGALMVAHDLGSDSAWVTLVVWPDRVEAHNHGKVGTFFKKGAGIESIPVEKIASVQSKGSGLWSTVTMNGSGNSIEFRTVRVMGEPLRSLISSLMQQESRTEVPAQAAADPVEQIRRLAELRDSGILTDAEFDAKKTDILSRM